MIYIRDNNDVLEKYEVVFDKEELYKLRIRVITNCSQIRNIKRECKFDNIPRSSTMRNATGCYYDNIKYKKSGNKTTELEDYYEYQVDLYDCEYTEYKIQPLINYIDGIIHGNEKCITILFNKDIKSVDSFLTVRERIDLLKKELAKKSSDYILREQKIAELNDKYFDFNKRITNISDNYKELEALIRNYNQEITKLDKSIDERKNEIYKELNDLLSIESLNKGQEKIDKYFYELVSLVNFKLVDTIGKDDIDRINKFYEEDIIDITKKKVKKLTK